MMAVTCTVSRAVSMSMLTSVSVSVSMSMSMSTSLLLIPIPSHIHPPTPTIHSRRSLVLTSTSPARANISSNLTFSIRYPEVSHRQLHYYVASQSPADLSCSTTRNERRNSGTATPSWDHDEQRTPHDNTATHQVLLTGRKQDGKVEDEDDRWRCLTELGIPVYVIPDSHVFAIMSRVNKVILATHTVLANGGLVAAAGAHLIAQAAKSHQTPVVVLSGVYKLSPVYPFDLDELIEYGDAGSVVPYEDGEFVDKVDVEHPLYDYVPADLVDLYITNL